MPQIVQRAWIMPPQSQLAPLTESERSAAFQADGLYPHYRDAVDSFSAFEALQQQPVGSAEEVQAASDANGNAEAAKKQPAPAEEKPGLLEGFLGGLSGGRKKSGQGLGYDLADSVGSQINRQVTNAITRTIMGVIKKMWK